MSDLDTLARLAAEADGRGLRWFGSQEMVDRGLHPDDAAYIAAMHPEVGAALVEVARAAQDVYRTVVGEHGHDETHSAGWPSCLPAHIAMNRYRAALDRLAEVS
jgi:hypothetical protein